MTFTDKIYMSTQTRIVTNVVQSSEESPLPGCGVARGYVKRIRIWPPTRNEHSGVLIGASGTRRSDWPERV